MSRYPTLPRATLPNVSQHRDVMRHVVAGGTSLDNARVADWLSPTSLDFEVELIRSKRYRSTTMLVAGIPCPPEVIEDLMRDVLSEARRTFIERDVVVDHNETVGFMFEPHNVQDLTRMVLEVLTWPRVEGATVMRKDSTL